MVYFGAKENNAVILPHSAQRKHAFIETIMVRLENGDRTLVQEGWHNTMIVYGTRVMYDYTRFVLGLDSISLNVRRTWKLSIQNENNFVLKENSAEGKPCINRESNINELAI